MRTDIHRPSQIQPEDYQFVGLETQKIEGVYDVLYVAEERKAIQSHMNRTGGTYSNHDHGGNCHICGAHCIYTALFHHEKTNTYIRTGMDCAEKMWNCDERRFRVFRDAIKAAQEHQAGKRKAQGILEAAGLSRAWEIYSDDSSGPGPDPWAFDTIRDIVEKLVRYGSISEKQEKFIASLINRIDNADKIQAQRKAENDAAEDAPSGRVEFVGEVISVKEHISGYGIAWKMLVKSIDKGFKVYCTIPSSMDVVKGSRVQLKVTVERSKDDPKFGFGKRPSGRVIELAATA